MPRSTQFLNTVLSERGPSALPYDDKIKWLIRQHLVALMEEFQDMELSTSIFNQNDGTTTNLIIAQGTIPMVYQEVTYHIPISIWLLESYCMQRPLVYVTPTSDMVIKRDHLFVDASGLVSSSYLTNWDFHKSNLVDMMKNLIILFEQKPPLLFGPKPPQLFGPKPPLFTSAAQNLRQESHGGEDLDGHMSSSHGHPPSPRDNPITPSQQTDHHQLKKEAIINKLAELFHNDIAELKKTNEWKIDGNFSIQDLLRGRHDELDKGLRELQEERENLEQQFQSLSNSIDVLETWLHDNQTKQPNFDIEDAFETSDVLSKQMLESSAADMAIEDLVYNLDEAVQEGAISVEAYLKNVRTLSREQFFHRATANTVNTAQLQSRVANIETRDSTTYVSLLKQVEDYQNCEASLSFQIRDSCIIN